MDHCITKSNPKEKKIKIQIKSLSYTYWVKEAQSDEVTYLSQLQ